MSRIIRPREVTHCGMRRRTKALVGVAVIAVMAFLFLAPVIPFSMTVYTGLMSPQVPASPHCSNPLDLSGNALVNVVLVYTGYGSIIHHMSGVGFMLYTECTIK